MKSFVSLAIGLPGRIAAPLAWIAPLFARITVGWVFLNTGWGKLQNLEAIIDYFQQLGIPFAELQAPFVATTELVCGTMILLGALTRVAAVPLAITMIVAIATAQWPQVTSLAGFLGLVETLYLAIFAWLALAGPGPVSVDGMLERIAARDEPAETLASAGRSALRA